ncbi:thioredoxin-like protein [Ampelomyces quisqualis]|uniref:Thioredoxin-like protein n=1 Tax=Ampelomyces quisqualis TaxID=50730 RepID=A0A6A5R378_AMPQU|nr:thioredoxin-like protein [Ampelomyces quisqualis]
MTTTAAQDEFHELLREKEGESRHPEDRHDDSDLSDPESAGAADDYLEKADTDDELDLPRNMRSNYYMPSLRSEANTGPKGVIADAQAFEQAKKQARRFTWMRSASPTQYTVTASALNEKDGVSSEDDSEDNFMREWRAARLRELQNVGQKIRSRTNSPSRRIYGNFPLVDAEGYLDALEKSSPDTIVVVFVYADNQPDLTRELQEHMREVAKRNDTIRFIQLHNSDAEMPPEGLPAVIGYKHGEKIGGIVPLMDEMPKDSELSAVSIETCLRRSRIL